MGYFIVNVCRGVGGAIIGDDKIRETTLTVEGLRQGGESY